MVTMERDLPKLNQLPLPTQMLTLMRGTDTTDTVATDGEVTTGLTATTATTERGPLMLNLQLSQLLPLTLKLMLMLGMDTTDTGVTGAKPTNREVDSSSDCDFPSTLASISRACA